MLRLSLFENVRFHTLWFNNVWLKHCWECILLSLELFCSCVLHSWITPTSLLETEQICDFAISTKDSKVGRPLPHLLFAGLT